jgi:hypothetical protein
MIRLHAVVEGQTEETFVNRVLSYHLGQFDISIDARRVETGRRPAKIFRGGLRKYQQARKDLDLWMKEDRHPDAYFTTMFDLYALPSDFPGYDTSRQCASPYGRVAALEEAFEEDLDHPRFIAYIQLHEFEALLLSDPAKFDWEFLQNDQAIRNLIQMAASVASPELINDDPTTAPSKRIIREIPEYEGRKPSAGPLIAEKIGIPTIRTRCVHFDAWLTRLEALS